MQFNNRKHAGQLLAEKFNHIQLDKKNTVVIAIPRGGVPVAHEIAKKRGAPFYPELT